jgi:N-acetylmuramoyl-L-alanine amidase
MGDSIEHLRRGALEIGQKAAQIIIFVCMLAFVGVVLASQSRTDEPSSAPALGFSTRTPIPTSPPTLEATVTVAVVQPLSPTDTPNGKPTPVPRPTYTSAPTATPGPTATSGPYVPRIGVVAGHWWLDETGKQSLDVGAVCDEGTSQELTEMEINLDVAQRIFHELVKAGYDADLLQEWDERLAYYHADVLISVHADACLYPEASGFKVARVADSHVPEIEDQLVDCLVERYGARTGLAFHEGSITADMARYHTFYEIDPNTPGAIIEIGFMLADRWLLTQRADLVAQGIIDGILCFLEEEGKLVE